MNFFSIMDINTEKNAPFATKEAARRIKSCPTSLKMRLLLELWNLGMRLFYQQILINNIVYDDGID